jgi:uncharacterized protein (DUF1697 family)
MAVHVAFLRAINLGSTRRFAKDDVARVTEAAGFTGVATHLNTGNVRLETSLRSPARIAERLERAYRDDRGFEVPAIVLSAAELRAVLDDAVEVGEGHAGKQYVSLLREKPSAADVRALEARSGDHERVVVRGRAAHLLLGESYQTTRLGNDVVERHLGAATNRTLAVVRTVVERWCQPVVTRR